MERVTISIEEYRDLLSIKKKDLESKIQKNASLLKDKGLTDILFSLSKLNEWKFEYEAIQEELERTAPKFCADDIPF